MLAWELMLMMRPWPCWSMILAAAWQQKKRALALTFIMPSQSASVTSTASWLAPEAGVVDEDVEAAVVALGGGEDGFYFIEVGDVAGEGVGFAAGFLDFLLEGFEFGEVAGGEGDFGAGLGEGEGEAAADAFASAGDEGDLILDVEGVGGHGKGRIN